MRLEKLQMLEEKRSEERIGLDDIIAEYINEDKVKAFCSILISR